MCKFCLSAGFLSEATFCEELEILRNQFWYNPFTFLIAQVVLAFQLNSFLFRVVGYSDADRFIAPKNNRVDMVENNSTHSYMIKGRQVYQQCGRVTILYWGTFDTPFKQLKQQSIPKFYFGRKTHVCTFALGIAVFHAKSSHNIYFLSHPLCWKI